MAVVAPTQFWVLPVVDDTTRYIGMKERSRSKADRLTFAGMFLEQIVIPLLENGEAISHQRLEQSMNDFRFNHPVRDTDFGTEHVWVAAWLAVQQLNRNSKLNSTNESACFERALRVLTALQLQEDQ